MKKPEKMILTAGPSITQKEIDYIHDAAKNGWNFHLDDYVVKFEKTLASYVGLKHCVAVTRGTHALHLGLVLFGIGPGDEVIIPDMTFVACSNTVEYMGAKPVFVDIDPDTWCINVDSFQKAITSRTKAVMPVWMYGSAPAMEKIKEIAEKHHIKIIEDSCPALGSIYQGRSAGTWGDCGTFSFQGAKIATMGQGGALITDDDDYHTRTRSLYKHGRDFGREFWHDKVGYMYEPSNAQAALGLAQVERIEELVARKRQIFQWYHDRLADIPCITMNCELPNARTNYWMSSIVLQENAPIKRDDLRKALRERNIDTRPFFYPLSMFPLYEGKVRVNNPVAYRVGLNGINLPSGVLLTEEIVDYVASHVRELLTA